MKQIYQKSYRYLCLVLIALCLFSFAKPGNSQTSPFFLQMGSASGQQGETVTIPVSVKAFENVFSMQSNLGWDSNDIQFGSLSFPPGNPLGLSNANFNFNQPGKMLFTWFDQNAVGVDLPDETVIFNLNFEILTTDTTPISIYPNLDGIPFYNEITQDVIGVNPTLIFYCGYVFPNTSPLQALQIDTVTTQAPPDCTAPPTGSISVEIFSNGTLPFTANWTGPNGFQATTLSIADLFPGSYDLRLTDAEGLLARTVVMLGGQPPKFTGQAFPTSCSGDDGCIELSVISGVGPYEFDWSAPGLFGDEVCGLSPGMYTVTVTGSQGCPAVDSFEITSSDSLYVEILSSAANCVNDQLGTALANPKNGQAPYQFLWSIAANTQLITGLFAGPYYVTVIDDTGCTGTEEVYIPDATIANWDLYLQPVCGGSNGQGDVLLLSGFPASLNYPMTVVWNNGSTQLVSGPDGDTLAVLQDAPSGVYGLTISDTLGCGQMLEIALDCLGPAPADSAALVWPGDADNNNAVNHHDLLYLGLAHGASGPVRNNATIDWTGQPAEDWPQNTGDPAVNFKNMDTNGDGLINAADTLAIVANWGSVIDPLDDNPFATPTAVPGMGPKPAPVLSLPADSLFAGQMVYIPVMLGSEDIPADSLHGLAFSISYDPEILQAVYFQPLPSWLGDPADGLISVYRNFPGQNRLDVALSRTDGLPADGYGVIGRTFIIIEDDIFFKGNIDETESGAGGAFLETTLFLRNIRARTPSNFEPEIKPKHAQLRISPTVGVRQPGQGTANVQLFPNPVSDILRVSSPDSPLRKIEIFTIWGQAQAVYPDLQGLELEIPVRNWPKGTYLAKVFTDEGFAVQLFICQ